MPLTLDDLTRFLAEDLFIDDAIQGDTALFSSGLLDSVSMVNLITYIEEKADTNVHPADVTLENFDTPNLIVDYVAKLG